MQGRREPVSEFVAIADQRHSKPQTGERSEKSDHCPLPQKNPDDLGNVCAERFHNSDLAPFLHSDSDERAHDSERRDHDNKEQEKEHHVALQSNRFEKLVIHFGPGLGEHRRLEKLIERFFHLIRAEGIVGPHGDAMQRVAEIVKFLRDVDRHENKLGVVLIATRLEDAGDGQIFWQNNLAQFIERFLFIGALGGLEILNLVENLSEIAGRINSQLVADADAQNAGEIAPEHGQIAIEIELSILYEFANRNDFFFLRRIDSAHYRRETLILKFNNDRTLRERRGRDHVRRALDFLLQRAPIANHVFALHQNVSVEIDDLLPQLAIEAGHDRDHKNEDGDAEGDPDDRDQRDDGKKRALRFEITEREKKAERQFQVADMLAANAPVYNPTGCA